MRCMILGCVVLAACAKAGPAAQNPLDYLQVGVDPRQEADAIIADLRRHGFVVGHRIDESSYVAFDARSDGDSTVRVITSRGVALLVESPDARWPERLWVELAPDLRLDFDQDGERDIVVAMRERDRTCLAWAAISRDGFASEVFRPQAEWGESPCVLEIDLSGLRLVLEVTVPNAREARVRLPIQASGRDWVVDDSAYAAAQWTQAMEQRREALKLAELRGDARGADRIRAELAWLARLRAAPEPVLEPADDGEEAR